MRYPFARHRPTRESDNAGGYTESDREAITVYGIMKFYEDETYITMDVYEDVRTNDLLRTEIAGQETEWRVVRVRFMSGRRNKNVYVEKTERPITP